MDNHSYEIANHGYINQGNHQGDIRFQMRDVPPPYHQNAIRCPQCDNFTWRDTPDCVYCGCDIRLLLTRQSIRSQIRYSNYRINELGKWLIGTSVIILASMFLGYMQVALVGFIAACIQSEMSRKIERNKKNLENRLLELSY